MINNVNQLSTQNIDSNVETSSYVNKSHECTSKCETIMAKSNGQWSLQKRCWKGYTPVAGKKPYSEGSCEPIKKDEVAPESSNNKHTFNSAFKKSRDISGEEVNSEMMMGDLKSIKKHTDEISRKITAKDIAPDWVKFKVSEAASNLSTVADFLNSIQKSISDDEVEIIEWNDGDIDILFGKSVSHQYEDLLIELLTKNITFLEETNKSDYGPKDGGQYTPADNEKRKSKNVGEQVESGGKNVNVKSYSSKPGQLSAKQSAEVEARKYKKLNRKQPVKIFSPEEIKAMNEKRSNKLAASMNEVSSENEKLFKQNDWSPKAEHKSDKGGLTEAGRKSYNKATGGHLKAPQPGGGPRKRSFCARNKGQIKMHGIDCKKDPEKRACKARRRWKCTN